MTVRTTTTARCHWTPETHTGCGWTHTGEPADADRAAEQHTKTTKHGTTVTTRPTHTKENDR